MAARAGVEIDGGVGTVGRRSFPQIGLVLGEPPYVRVTDRGVQNALRCDADHINRGCAAVLKTGIGHRMITRGRNKSDRERRGVSANADNNFLLI